MDSAMAVLMPTISPVGLMRMIEFTLPPAFRVWIGIVSTDVLTGFYFRSRGVLRFVDAAGLDTDGGFQGGHGFVTGGAFEADAFHDDVAVSVNDDFDLCDHNSVLPFDGCAATSWAMAARGLACIRSMKLCPQRVKPCARVAWAISKASFLTAERLSNGVAFIRWLSRARYCCRLVCAEPCSLSAWIPLPTLRRRNTATAFHRSCRWRLGWPRRWCCKNRSTACNHRLRGFSTDRHRSCCRGTRWRDRRCHR